MNRTMVLALAVAGAFAVSAGALADGTQQRSVELRAPPPAGDPPTPSRPAVGVGEAGGNRPQIEEAQPSQAVNVEYWRIDEQPSEVGATSGAGGSGTIRYD